MQLTKQLCSKFRRLPTIEPELNTLKRQVLRLAVCKAITSVRAHMPARTHTPALHAILDIIRSVIVVVNRPDVKSHDRLKIVIEIVHDIIKIVDRLKNPRLELLVSIVSSKIIRVQTVRCMANKFVPPLPDTSDRALHCILEAMQSEIEYIIRLSTS